MRNVFACYKRIAFSFAFVAFLICFFSSFSVSKLNVAYAETNTDVESELGEKIDETLDDIDTSELDQFLNFEIEAFDFGFTSFKDIVKFVLDGNLFTDVSSVTDIFVLKIKDYFLSLSKLIVTFLVLVLLYKFFNSFCEDKYSDVKKVVKIIFSLVIVLLLVSVFKTLAGSILSVANKMFDFGNILFPILLNLLLLSGANTSFGAYGTLSVFLLNTCSYIFIYVLIPVSVSILVLDLAGSVFQKGNLSKVSNVLKSVFKYVIIGLFFVFGLFSSVNLVTSGMKDGLQFRLTKYAIKNYIPVLGGYISDGFDFVKYSSMMIKNSVGVCGVFVLFFMVAPVLILYVSYIFAFKILSVIVLFLGEKSFADTFENVSNSISYLVSVLIGVFLILLVFVYLIILSVSVV